MENNTDILSQIGQNRLEQVYMNMPEVRFYFSGDKEQSAENLAAYIGNDQLEFQHLQTFSEGDGGINYYLLLDVSASISEQEFRGITNGLIDFCGSVRPQDQVTCLTFGEEVKMLFQFDGQELIDGAADELLNAVKNPDQRTLLFEAIRQMAELCDSVPASESTRRVGMVITDGADIATGKATSNEALQFLQENGIPVYGFAADSAKRQDKNAFGEFSRSTGGYLTIIEKGNEAEGFEQVREEILQSYEAIFSAGSNKVNHERTNVVLQLKEEEIKQQMQVMNDRWIPDTENPEIVEVVQEGQKQIRVVFSEAVTGAEAAENFHLKSDAENLIPAFASPGSDKTSVVLSFADEIPAGEYTLECSNMKDCSMESNLLEAIGSVTIAGTEQAAESIDAATEPKEETSSFGLTAILIVLAALLAAAAVFWKKFSKRSAVVTVENKAVLKENVSVSHHVVLEKKELEEKQVYFHVIGQKEEIPIVIKKSMIVGRSSICELVFDDPALSRQHFALELKDGGIMIRNLSSSGFTEVNGMKLGNQSRPLHSGDEIHAGQIRMTIRW